MNCTAGFLWKGDGVGPKLKRFACIGLAASGALYFGFKLFFVPLIFLSKLVFFGAALVWLLGLVKSKKA